MQNKYNKINEQYEFYSEMVRVRKDFGHQPSLSSLYQGFVFKKGQIGRATAYLPENRTFAVDFGNQIWVTFQDWSEKDFLEHFEIIREGEDYEETN